MWAQICLSAWVREISGTPTRSCISGETLRGFMMPRGCLPVEGCDCDAAAEVTIRSMRKLAGWASLREECGGGGAAAANDAVSPAIKVEKRPRDAAMSFAQSEGMECAECCRVKQKGREFPFSLQRNWKTRAIKTKNKNSIIFRQIMGPINFCGLGQPIGKRVYYQFDFELLLSPNKQICWCPKIIKCFELLNLFSFDKQI